MVLWRHMIASPSPEKSGALKRAVFFLEKIKKFLTDGEKTLDLGSGSGHMSVLLQETYKQKVCSLEIEPKFGQFGNKIIYIRTAKELATRYNIPIIFYDGDKIPFADKQFDNVLVAFVLHHAEHPDHTLAEAARVTNKYIFLFEDIPSNLWQTFWYRLGDSFVNFEFWGHPHNNKTREEWVSLCNELKLEVVYEESWVGHWLFFPFPNTLFVLKKNA